MKKYFLEIVMVLLVVPASAQLFPLSDFYIFNGLAINPAYAGSNDALSTTIQYRKQWIGFNDAPINSMLSAHAPFFSDRMGLGMMITRSSFGIYKETSFMGNYAYRISLPHGKLALGLAFGLTAYRVAWEELEAADPDDNILSDNSTSSVLPDFSLGAYYYGTRAFVGFSLPFFLTHVPADKSGDYKIKNEAGDYNYFLTGGYSLTLCRNLDFKPTFLVKYNSHEKLHGDLYLQAEAYKMISAGAGIRSTGMLIGTLSCRVNQQLTVSYSFDSDSGRTGNYKRGSHEVLIGYIFKYDRNVMSPSEL